MIFLNHDGGPLRASSLIHVVEACDMVVVDASGNSTAWEANSNQALRRVGLTLLFEGVFLFFEQHAFSSSSGENPNLLLGVDEVTNSRCCKEGYCVAQSSVNCSVIQTHLHLLVLPVQARCFPISFQPLGWPGVRGNTEPSVEQKGPTLLSDVMMTLS